MSAKKEIEKLEKLRQQYLTEAEKINSQVEFLRLQQEEKRYQTKEWLKTIGYGCLGLASMTAIGLVDTFIKTGLGPDNLISQKVCSSLYPIALTITLGQFLYRTLIIHRLDR